MRSIRRSSARPSEFGPGLFVIVELTRAFEEAADALMHSAHLLREQTLARVVRSEPPPRARRRMPRPRRRRRRPRPDEHVYVLGDPSLPVPDASTIGAKAHGLARIARAGCACPRRSC